jgi:hypothetical protein
MMQHMHHPEQFLTERTQARQVEVEQRDRSACNPAQPGVPISSTPLGKPVR